MFKFKVTISITVISCLLFVNSQKVDATVSVCSASVSPSSVVRNTSSNFTFTINNTDSVTYNWIKIERPSAATYTLTNGSLSGWSVSTTANDVTFTGGTVAASGSVSPVVTATIADFTADPTAWTVQVSDSGGGSPFNCSGSLGTAITDLPEPEITNIVVSEVSDTSVKITWTTDLNSNSVIDYGTTASYGSTAGDTNASTTSHSVTLTSLTANTTYHYNVKSTASGVTGTSGDNTFVTAKAGTTSSSSSTSTTTTTTSKASPTPTPKPIVDSTPPQIVFDTEFDKPFDISPKITGKALDSGATNVGISKVEYSIDDGKNWLPVDEFEKNIFEFTPVIFEDGNYKVRVRARDLSGNLGYSEVKTLVIDRLPPQVGGSLFSIGPQILSPNENGLIFALAGLDQKITLSAVGGPTEIDILSNLSGLSHVQTYSLVKNPDNGLWSGTLSFAQAGLYSLKAKSVDGAGNKTERNLNSVVVLESGLILDENGSPIKDAEISLYYLEPTTNQFILWDGKSFGQENPQKVAEDGRYRLLTPPGKYYLKVSAPGYKTLTSNIFTLDQSLPINTNFKLTEARGISIGHFFISWPDLDEAETAVSISSPVLPQQPEQEILGKEIPYFSLLYEGKTLTSNDLRGKVTILTFLSTWSPFTSEQLALLADLSTSNDINSIVIMSQETVSKVDIFKKMGTYNLKILADPDGQLVEPLNILTFPTHFLIDRKAVIRKIKVGVLNQDQLIDF